MVLNIENTSGHASVIKGWRVEFM